MDRLLHTWEKTVNVRKMQCCWYKCQMLCWKRLNFLAIFVENPALVNGEYYRDELKAKFWARDEVSMVRVFFSSKTMHAHIKLSKHCIYWKFKLGTFTSPHPVLIWPNLIFICSCLSKKYVWEKRFESYEDKKTALQVCLGTEFFADGITRWYVNGGSVNSSRGLCSKVGTFIVVYSKVTYWMSLVVQSILRLPVESVFRGTYGSCFSTTLGSVCHELGHTFDLGHPRQGIMGRGFDNVHLVFLADWTNTVSPYIFWILYSVISGVFNPSSSHKE